MIGFVNGEIEDIYEDQVLIDCGFMGYNIFVCKNVIENSSIGDEIKLYTRIIIPDGVDKCPLIFIRTPYEKALAESPLCPQKYETNIFLDAGYALVYQHCRGTGESEGECIPYKNEREDGLFTLEYIRTLDFYNGEIYLMGGSYLSSAHLLYLADKPKDIKGAVLEIQTDRMYYRNYMNGCNYNFCNEFLDALA